MKHRVIVQLDAEQVRFLHSGLEAIGDKAHITSQDRVEIEKLRNLMLTAKEVCENRDRADEAERKLSQLVTRSVTQ